MNFSPSQSDKIARNIDRIKTLKIAINETYNQDRLTSLNNELARREGELKAVKLQIEEAIK